MKNTDIYHELASFGRELLQKTSLEEGLPMIATHAKSVIGAERCSIFMYDARHHELWTTLADGVERIVIPSQKGLVGFTIKERKPIVANDPYTHPEFLSEIDKETGFITKNVITAPIFSSKREILGILELLNKEGGFDAEDVKFMIFFAHYVSGFLELVKVYKRKNEKKK